MWMDFAYALVIVRAGEFKIGEFDYFRVDTRAQRDL